MTTYEPIMLETDQSLGSVVAAWLGSNADYDTIWPAIVQQLSQVYRKARQDKWFLTMFYTEISRGPEHFVFTATMYFHSSDDVPCKCVALGRYDYHETASRVYRFLDRDAQNDWAGHTILMWKKYGGRLVYNEKIFAQIVRHYKTGYTCYILKKRVSDLLKMCLHLRYNARKRS